MERLEAEEEDIEAVEGKPAGSNDEETGMLYSRM
jgi:hypothetical protein